MSVATANEISIQTTPPSRLSRAGAFLRRPTALATAVAGVVVAWLALAPLGVVVWDTVWNGTSLTFGGLKDAYTAYGIGKLFTDSFAFAIGTTIYAVVQGGVLAYLAARTNTLCKSLLFASSLVPLITPGVLSTIAWIYIGSPKTGLLNHWLEPIFGPSAVNVYSIPGMIFIEGQHLAPLVFLLMYSALRTMDPSLEESALMSQAKRRTVIRRITLPMVAPAIYASIVIMMVRSLESFEVPALVGLPSGITVFTGRIWRALSDYPVDQATAGSYSIGLVLLSAVGMYWYTRLTRRGQKAYQTVTGKGYRTSLMDLGKARWPIGALIVLYFLVVVVLPLFVLVYGSTQSFYTPPSWQTLTHPTLANYRAVFSDRLIVHSFENSILLSVGAATAVALFMAVVAWVVVRTRVRGRALIDSLTSVPLAVPGIVLGFALLTVYLWVPVPIYGTIWILFLAYFTRFMPYGMRYASTSMLQIGTELEESARMSGATWFYMFRRVLVPLILPGLVAGWIYVVTVSLRELSASLLLYSSGNEVLSITIWDLWGNGRFPALAAVGVMMILGLLVIIVAARKLTSRFGVAEI